MSHKLLLADDSVTIQRVIELTFADEDVQVVVVGDGRQAIERVRAERPDIVLADIGMPERDGYEVAAFIKNDPELAQIPVLLLTGAFEPLDEGRARAAGCDGVLVKPFEPQMVINRVNELLAGRRPLARPQPAAPQPAAQEQGVQPPAAGHSAGSSGASYEHAAPAEGREPAAPAAPGRPAIPDALEDYFDRLDQAFANIGGPPPRPPVLERPPHDAAVSRDSAPGAPDAARDAAAARDTTAPREHAPGPAERARPEQPPAPAPEPAGRREPAPTATLAAPRQAPADLATAFAALLAAEEGHVPLPSPAPAPPPDPAAIPDEVIDNIVHRVIARMGDESMRRAVVDTAERLVREEIDRIKRVGAGGAGF